MTETITNTYASCYAISSDSNILQAFHYSSTGAGGKFL